MGEVAPRAGARLEEQPGQQKGVVGLVSGIKVWEQDKGAAMQTWVESGAKGYRGMDWSQVDLLQGGEGWGSRRDVLMGDY